MPHQRCKICKTPLQIEEACFPEAFGPESIVVTPSEPRQPANSLTALLCLICVFVWYLLTGYVGKLIMLASNWDFTMYTFFEFWSWLHILGSVFITAMSMFTLANCFHVMNDLTPEDS